MRTLYTLLDKYFDRFAFVLASLMLGFIGLHMLALFVYALLGLSLC